MIPVERAHLNVAARSHPGMSGKNNEDRYAVFAFILNTNKPEPAILAVVADGIGGHRAGEVAAEIAVTTISQAVTNSGTQQPVQTLQEAIIRAGQSIYQQSEIDHDRKGMGATCACGWVIGDRLYMASVGDSRIYLLRGNTIHQLSTDHTWVQEAIESGTLTPEQARGHPNAHVIRRYLGSRQPVVPDLRLRLYPGESDDQAEANQGLRLLPGDQLLLCSDGLTDLVSETEILESMQSNPMESAIDMLIDLANQRGGHDNITIVALEMPEPVAVTAPVSVTGRRRGPSWACLGLIGALLAIGVLTLSGLYWLLNGSLTLPVSTQAVTGVPVTLTPAFSEATATIPSLAPVTSPTVQPGLRPTRTPLPASLTPWPTNTLEPQPETSPSPVVGMD